MKKIIKNGTIISSRDIYKADILIEGEKIKDIATNIECIDCEFVDASGCYVLPGAIDVHTHFDLQTGVSRTVDDFYSGTVAAAYGGTTTIVDHIAFGPRGCNLHHQIQEYHKLADDKAIIDYSFHGVFQHIDDNILKEMESLVEEGIPSFKVYLTYDFKLNDAEIYQVLKRAKELNAVIAFHAENNDIVTYFRNKFVAENKLTPEYHALSRPPEAEVEAVERLIVLSKLAENSNIYIVHISSSECLDVIKKARAKGMTVYSETCPQYLLLTDECYKRKDALKYIISPPIRKQHDCDVLWNAISESTIDVVATDHCPFRYQIEKQLGKDNFTHCPNGGAGVEERLIVMFSEGVKKGRINIMKLVEILCENPAKIYGLYPQKGALLPNFDADVVVLDPNKKTKFTNTNIHSKVDYTFFDGKEYDGKIKYVIQRGNILLQEGKLMAQKGQGKFLKRKRLKEFI